MGIITSTILPFLFVFTLLVLVHELGHFVCAKLAGVRVEEFGIGLPPRIWSKTIKDTVYSINCIPVGGFVKLLGENGNLVEEVDQNGKVLAVHIDTSPDNFSNKPAWQRALILCAGVAMNFLLAWFIFTILFTQGFLNKPAGLQIAEVIPNSAAAVSGIQPNDTILKAYTDQGEEIPLLAFSESIKNDTTETYTLTIQRTGEELAITTRPQVNDQGIITLGIMYNIIKDNTKLPLIESIVGGLQFNLTIVAETIVMVGELIRSLATSIQIPEAVHGPVGIIKITSDAAQLGFTSLLFLLGVISVNLAVLNIMPFPALDGGRLMVIAIESITRHKLPARWEIFVHSTGFILLLLFIIAITFKDIMNLWGG